jgi:diguanylate cyclase
MNRQIFSKDNETTTLRDNVHTIANEVLNVLKELAKKHGHQLDVEQLAEKILKNDAVTQILTNYKDNNSVSSNSNTTSINETAGIIIGKLSEIIPEAVINEHENLKKQFYNSSVLESPINLLETAIRIIKIYFNAVAIQHAELVDFMKQAIFYADEIERHMKGDQLAKNTQFNEDRNFEDSIASNINRIKYDVSTAADLYELKTAVLQKLAKIASTVVKKREQDMSRFKENERNLDEMRRRMKDMKREASEIRKKAEEIDLENVRDPLTGLYNRKAFDQKMLETLADVKRYNTISTFMICDIDSFKLINDNFGHKVGDLALKKLSSLLKEKTNPNDFIARYGGEEFAIIFPGTSINDAKKTAEDIRSLISNTEFSYKDNAIPFSISIGLSEFRKVDDSNTVFERADKALYLAKASGKNILKTDDELEV